MEILVQRRRAEHHAPPRKDLRLGPRFNAVRVPLAPVEQLDGQRVARRNLGGPEIVVEIVEQVDRQVQPACGAAAIARFKGDELLGSKARRWSEEREQLELAVDAR